MKTILVTTAYITEEHRKQQTLKFLRYYTNPSIVQDLGISSILVMENGSYKELIEEFKKECYDISTMIKVHHFENHIARNSHLSYGYLWRSLFNLKKQFRENDKIIYMDNDFYVLSKSCANFIKGLSNCWSSFYCNRHKFPETGIQILTKNNSDYNEFINKNWDKFVNLSLWDGETMEVTLPVTVHKDILKGDRYSEYTTIPDDADFAAQVKLEDIVNYHNIGDKI